jgi:hypothetical protein
MLLLPRREHALIGQHAAEKLMQRLKIRIARPSTIAFWRSSASREMAAPGQTWSSAVSGRTTVSPQ